MSVNEGLHSGVTSIGASERYFWYFHEVIIWLAFAVIEVVLTLTQMSQSILNKSMIQLTLSSSSKY